MLTQYDAVILAGIPTSDLDAASRERFRTTYAASSEKPGVEKAERISRLEILLEPVSEVVSSARTLLGIQAPQKQQAASIPLSKPTI